MTALERVGQFTLVESLHVSDVAELFLATYPSARRPKLAVVRRLLPAAMQRRDWVTRFLEGADVATQIDHPGFARVLEVGELEGLPYVASEYIVGKNLEALREQAWRSSNPIPLPFIAAIASKVAEALGALHSRKDAAGMMQPLTHGALSARNVFLSYEGEVKVAGLGTPVAGASETELLGPRLAYSSPEQVRIGVATPRSDIFSLGVLLHELLTGVRLFDGPSEEAIRQRLLDCEIPPLRSLNPQVPGALEELVLSLLRPTPNSRPADVRRIAEELRAFSQHNGAELGATQLSDFVCERFHDERMSEMEKLAPLTESTEVGPAPRKLTPAPIPGAPSLDALLGADALHPPEERTQVMAGLSPFTTPPPRDALPFEPDITEEPPVSAAVAAAAAAVPARPITSRGSATGRLPTVAAGAAARTLPVMSQPPVSASHLSPASAPTASLPIAVAAPRSPAPAPIPVPPPPRYDEEKPPATIRRIARVDDEKTRIRVPRVANEAQLAKRFWMEHGRWMAVGLSVVLLFGLGMFLGLRRGPVSAIRVQVSPDVPARLTIAGRLVPKGTPVSFPPGEYDLVATADGYRPYQQRIRVFETDRSPVLFTVLLVPEGGVAPTAPAAPPKSVASAPSPAAAAAASTIAVKKGFGRVALDRQPPGADIWVDGRFTWHQIPAGGNLALELPSGQHTLQFRLSDTESPPTTVDVHDGETASLPVLRFDKRAP